jgi:hypothetical protein
MHEVQFSTNDRVEARRSRNQVCCFPRKLRNFAFKPVWKYVGCKDGKHLRDLQNPVYYSAVLENLKSETVHFRT